jgi:hypothetical protein
MGKKKFGDLKSLFMVAAVLAVALPVLGMVAPGIIPVEMAMLVIVLIGFIAGLMGDVKWSVSLGVVGIFLITFGQLVSSKVPEVGGMLGEVFYNVGLFAGAMLIFPAFKEVMKKAGIKI